MFKRIILGLILVLLVCNTGWGGFQGTKQASENITFFLQPPLDSLYGIPRAPESVHVFTYADGDMKFSMANATYPFTAAGIDTIKNLGDTAYQFFGAISDIDGAGGNFLLNISVALFYDGVPTYTFASVQVIEDSLNLYLVDINDTTNAILETLQLWDTRIDSIENALADASISDKVWVDGSPTTRDSIEAAVSDGSIGDKVWVDPGARTITGTGAGAITSTSIATNAIDADAIANNAIDAGAIATDAITSAKIAANAIGESEIAAGAINISEMPTIAYFDTLIYRGRSGPGIWIDIGASNTNTAIGTDGTEKNPVSTLAAARTLADALGSKRYYIYNRSSFTGGNDLTVTHEDWEFIGVGANNSLELDVAGIDIDGSHVENLIFSGSQGGTDDICVANSLIGRLTGVDGHFHGSGLSDTIFIGNTDDLFLDNCRSEIAGNGRPGISFGAGITDLSMRHYSGGIELRQMAGTDNASIETDGQVVVNGDCSSAPITIRGHVTITDNGTNSVITKDAVFSRQEADLWVWSNTDTLAVDSSLMGEWLSTGISASLSDANMGAIADSVWDKDTTDAFAVADGIGIFVKDSAAQTAASAGISDADMIAIADTVWQRNIPDDTTDGAGDDVNAADLLFRAGDTTNWANIEDVWMNQDTTNVDTSEIGEWLSKSVWEPDTNTVSGEIITMLKDTSAYGGNDSVLVDVSAALGANGLVSATAFAVWNLFGADTQVEDSSGNTTTRVQTDLANATDDYYNGAMVVFYDATLGDDNRYRRITDYDGTNGWIVFEPALPAIPSDADPIYIIPWASVSATATISDADMAAIGDTLWGKDTSDISGNANAVGILMDAKISDAGGVASISDADMTAIMDSIFNRGIVRYTQGNADDSILQLAGMQVFAVSADFTAVEFRGDGAGEGFKTSGGDGEGNGMEIRNSVAGAVAANVGMGLKVVSSGSGADDHAFQAQNAGGAVAVSFNGHNGGRGFDVTATGTGAGQAMLVQSAHSDALQITAGDGASKHGIEIQGGTGVNGDAVAIRATGDEAIGVSIESTDSSGVRIVGNGGYGMDIEGDGTLADVIFNGTGHGEGFWDSVGVVGTMTSGARTVTLYVIDTIAGAGGIPDTLTGVNVEVQNQTGQRVIFLTSQTGGFIRFNATENDTFLVFTFGNPTQNFPGDSASGHDSVFITTGADVVDDLQGFTTSVGSPSGSNTTRMFVYAYDSKGNPVQNAILTSQMNTLGSEVEDTCSSFAPIKFNARARSDANGFVFLDLLQNDCVVGSDTYTFLLRLNSRAEPSFEVKMAVPSGVDSTRITAQ